MTPKEVRNLALSAALVVLLALAGCEETAGTPDAPVDAGTDVADDAAPPTDSWEDDPPGETVRSALVFGGGGAVDEAAVRELTAGQLALAAELLALDAEGPNRALSPVSLSLAFAMQSAGARGETLAELERVLHFPPQDVLHPTMGALLAALRARELPATADHDAVELRPVNQLFQERTFDVLAAFLDTLALGYDAGVQLVDFAGEPDATRLAINDWVLGRTNDRIADLLPERSIHDLTRLVLVNALYLKAGWRYAFREAETTDGVFHAAGGDVTVPFMRQEVEGARYARLGDFDLVELPLEGWELAFTIVVPRDGAPVDLASLRGEFDRLPNVKVRIALPRFRIKDQLDLKRALAELGVADLFDEARCDLSGINTTERLWVDGAFHQAFVDVNEKGVEAAAATAVITVTESEPTEVIVDEPFYFVLRDRATNAPLFVGFVADPGA